jgi:transcriptional regulator with XRE-family HTH domain
MSELVETLRSEFQDNEYRHAYAEECLNAMIAAQIKVLREQRGMTQKQLADATGMGQPRIPLLEDSSYENWTVNTLKRLAKAFDVALSVKFETFSRVIQDFSAMSRETLQRPDFADDLVFRSKRVPVRNRHRRRKHPQSRRAKIFRFSAYSNIGTACGFSASLNVDSNQAGARRKEPARAEFANSSIRNDGQTGLGELHA